VASSDRSLYCLDQETGERLWRQRADAPLNTPPAIAEGRVFQGVPGLGLVVLESNGGKFLWRYPEGGDFLGELEGHIFLLTGQGSRRVVRLDAATGKEEGSVEVGMILTAVGHKSDRSVLLASRTGELVCLRSKKAPRLKPAELAEVLRNDQKMRLLQGAAAKLAAKAEEKKAASASEEKKKSSQDLFGEFDWLRSKKGGRPVGSRLASETEEKGKKPAKEAKEAKAEKEDKEEGKAAKPDEEQEDEKEPANDEANEDEEEGDDEAKDDDEEEEEEGNSDDDDEEGEGDKGGGG